MNQDFFEIQCVDSASSTNDAVKAWGFKGKKEGAVLVARHQTAGKGRMGRSFYSPAGTGLYFSVLLRPNLPPKDALLLTTATAVAVAKAIGEQAQIKWVNDVYVNGKKVCGILTESVFAGENMDFAVVGVGVNLAPPQEGFPKEIESIAGAVFAKAPTENQTKEFLQTVLTGIYDFYQNIKNPAIWAEYNRRNFLAGKTVTAGEITGIVNGIDKDFGLLVETQTGVVKLAAGEATLHK